MNHLMPMLKPHIKHYFGWNRDFQLKESLREGNQILWKSDRGHSSMMVRHGAKVGENCRKARGEQWPPLWRTLHILNPSGVTLSLGVKLYRQAEPLLWVLVKLFHLAYRNISLRWSIPIWAWKAALSRFTIEFRDRLSAIWCLPCLHKILTCPIAKALNHRPWKRLCFKMLHEVFHKSQKSVELYCWILIINTWEYFRLPILLAIINYRLPVILYRFLVKQTLGLLH